MIEKREMGEACKGYGKDITLATIGSHSALDICDGAKEEGFKTLVIARKDRAGPYERYFRTRKGKGCVDTAIVHERYDEMKEDVERLKKENSIFIPNRSFTAYVDLDWIENDFRIPIFGSRELLKIEEERDYYSLLEAAKLPYPKHYKRPEEIDSLAIIKIPHAKMRTERGFFTAASYEEYREKTERLEKAGAIDKKDLEKAIIEKYIIGPVFNFDLFYSPLEQETELLGVDWRFESSLDGYVRLPAAQQLTLAGKQKDPIYTVVGHNLATVRESLLPKVFEMAERFVEHTKRKHELIGPFCLQTVVDENMDFYIYDVAVRIGGGTNVHMWSGHPYGNMLHRERMSTGKRIAREIKQAIEQERIEEVIS